MKRKFLLLSSTLLLVNIPVFAGTNDSAAVSSAASAKSAAHNGVLIAATSDTRKGGLAIPPPPKETTPGNTTGSTNYGSAPSQVKPPSAAVSAADKDKNVTVVGNGGPYASKNNAVQRFADYLNINQGMDGGPLKMTIENNGFKWFRMLIANQLIASEKSLKGKPTGEIDLSGIVGPGNNQIVIEAGGVPGSTISWKVTTVTQAKLEKADPNEGLAGDTIKITGKNFSSKPSEMKVTFNDHAAQIISSTETQLQVKIPSNTDIGDNKVVATVRGVKTNAIKVKVLVVPEVTGCNLGSAPPGFKLTIFGRNFAKNPSENKVFLGDHGVSVIAGDTTRLTVIVPQIGDKSQPVLGGLDWRQSTPGNYDPAMGSMPVKVQVGKLISKENVQFIIGRQIYPGIKGYQYDVGSGSATDNPYNAPLRGPSYGAPQPQTPLQMTDPDAEIPSATF